MSYTESNLILIIISYICIDFILWLWYYLFKEMTCLPEEVDSEYQAVFKEMATTCGIEVSAMEDLGRHSQ